MIDPARIDRVAKAAYEAVREGWNRERSIGVMPGWDDAEEQTRQSWKNTAWMFLVQFDAAFRAGPITTEAPK